MSRYTIDRDGNIRERPETPAERRTFLLYYASVLTREARTRRSDRKFAALLMDGAGRARREALSINITPRQGDLFAVEAA